MNYENVVFLYINPRNSKLYRTVKYVSSETSGNHPYAYTLYFLSKNI